MTTLPELPLELQSHILFFSTPPYTTLRVSKLWYNLTNDIYYKRLLKNLFKHRIVIEVGESYKEKFEGIWTTHFASCFQQKQLDEKLIEMYELIDVPGANFIDIGNNANIGYGTTKKDSTYLSKIRPVVKSLEKLGIPFSNQVEKINLYYAVEAEAYLRKYGNDLKNMDKLLIYYSAMGSLDAVKYLVSKGADPNKAGIAVRGSDGRTDDFNPLQMATWVGWMPIMKYLIEECHADINWKNARGETVLSEAMRDKEVISSSVEERSQYLLAHGLKPTDHDLEVIAEEVLVDGAFDFLSVYRDILNGCLDRMSKAIDRSIKKNIISEAEVQKIYKDFFDNLQKLKLPAIVLQALANHLELHAEQNMITAKKIHLSFEKVYAIVDSQVYSSDDEDENEKKMSKSLIDNFYIPIIKGFQSVENKLLEEEAKLKKSAEEVGNVSEEEGSQPKKRKP